MTETVSWFGFESPIYLSKQVLFYLKTNLIFISYIKYTISGISNGLNSWEYENFKVVDMYRQLTREREKIHFNSLMSYDKTWGQV